MSGKKRRVCREEHSASYIGPTNAEDPSLIPYLGESASKFVARGITEVGPSAYFTTYTRVCDCASARKMDTEWARIDTQICEYKDSLLALFFKFVDWTFPVVDKRAFYEKYFKNRNDKKEDAKSKESTDAVNGTSSTSSTNGINEEGKSTSASTSASTDTTRDSKKRKAGPVPSEPEESVNIGLLCAILGLGTVYWKYSKLLCIRPMPRNLVHDLWDLTIRKINHDIACTGPSLDTIQALLLYTQKRTLGDAYHEQVVVRGEIGRLVSLGYSLGLHCDCENWEIRNSEKLLRKRLAACIYYVEVWSALLLGHPSLMAVQTPFTSHWPQETPFVELVKLTRIVHQYANALNCGKPSDPVPTLSAINTWWEQLPPELQNMETKNNLNYCSNGMLHLSGLSAEVLVYRQLLDLSLKSGTVCTCWDDAKTLAKRILQYIARISHAHMHAFWLSPCKLLLSSVAHFVLRVHAHSSVEEKRQQAQLLRSFSGTLRTLNVTWQEGVQFAQERMDVLLHKGIPTIVLPQLCNTVMPIMTPEHQTGDADLPELSLEEWSPGQYMRADSPTAMTADEEALDTLLLRILASFDSYV